MVTQRQRQGPHGRLHVLNGRHTEADLAQPGVGEAQQAHVRRLGVGERQPERTRVKADPGKLGRGGPEVVFIIGDLLIERKPFELLQALQDLCPGPVGGNLPADDSKLSPDGGRKLAAAAQIDKGQLAREYVNVIELVRLLGEGNKSMKEGRLLCCKGHFSPPC